MSAIDLLEADHREVEDLFEELESASDKGEKQEIFEELADKLAVHATIEERHFYPAAKGSGTEDLVKEAAEEHLAVKRIIADLLAMDAGDDMFDAKVKVLKEQVEHHVEEEEGELFPKVKKLLDAEALDALEQEMVATREELMEEGAPREAVPSETDQAAPV
jgi:hemerythrin superfamily protein